jgi:uncharacterized membrane protein
MKSLRETLAASGLLCAIFTVALNYSALPQRIPDHFDANGLVNGWGDKSSLWFLVGITCVVYLGMTLIRFAPQSSFSVPVGPEQRAAAIPIALDMVAWLKAEITWLFAANTWSMVVVAQGRSHGLGAWFIPITLLTVFATVLYYIARMMRLGRSNADAQE